MSAKLRLTVLVVDDEPLIRECVTINLTDAGYLVMAASNADDALRVLERDPGVDILITDVDMPGSMDGLQLAFMVRDDWPPIKIIVASGKHLLEAVDIPDGAQFLAKPYQTITVLKLMARFE